MEDLYCQEQLQGETGFSPDQGYKTDYSDSLANWPTVTKAEVDPALLEDRVFRNMMDTEDCYISDNNYFENVQKEIKPHMRKLVTDWMLEVCCDQNCHVDVFLLSCNVMDRFLSQVNISKRQFQLVAAATIFIASKLVEPCPVPGTTLVKYTDNTYQLTELLEMELVILSRLKWDLSAVTPNAFLEHLLKMISDEDSLLERDLMKGIKGKADITIILCATEFRFSMYPPSMLSSAALAHSVQEMQRENLLGDLEFSVQELINRLQILTRVENDCLNDCIYQIERAKEANGASNQTFQQAVCNQRSENTNNTQQQQQHLPSEPVIDIHVSPVPVTIAPSQAKNHQKTPESSSHLSGHPDSPERVTPTEVLEVDLLEVS